MQVSYVPYYSHATDGLLDGSFLDHPQRFDFEAAVAEWLQGEVAAGRATVRHYGDSPTAATGYHLRTTRGTWRALAIRNRRDGSAYSKLLGRSLVACAR